MTRTDVESMEQPIAFEARLSWLTAELTDAITKRVDAFALPHTKENVRTVVVALLIVANSMYRTTGGEPGRFVDFAGIVVRSAIGKGIVEGNDDGNGGSGGAPDADAKAGGSVRRGPRGERKCNDDGGGSGASKRQ